MITVLEQKQLRRIFHTSVNLADLVEDLLERAGDFDPKFKKGLLQSIKEASQKKTRKVHSLLELR